MLSLGNKLTLTTQPIYKFVNEHSIDFDGVDDRIITDGADTVAQPTTYSFWCKSSTTGFNPVFGHGNYNIGSFSFNYDNTRPKLYLENNSFRYWDDTSKQDDGEWHHWVVYLDTDINNTKLYCDGVLQNVDETVSTGTPTAYTESLTIGATKVTGGSSFNGNIDEFAVYDRELTQAEITRMYNTYYSPNRVANSNFSQIGNEEVTNGDFSQIGSEEVTNGDFATDSDWSDVNSVSTITNGQLVFNNSTLGGKYQSTSMVVGKIYKLVYTIVSISNGYIQPRLGDTGLSTQRTSAGTYTEYITCAGDTILRVYGSTTDGIVDNVSVKEVGQSWEMNSTAIFTANGINITTGGYIRQDVLTSGKSYQLTYDIISYTSGNIRVYDGTDQGNIPTVLGSNTFNFTAGGTAFYIQSNSVSVNLVIDNISVKEVGQHWTFGTGWSTDGTKASRIAQSGSTSTYQSVPFVAGKTYKIIYDLDISAGEFKIRIGGGTLVDTTIRTTSGTYTETIVANAGNNVLNLRANNGAFVGSVDNIVIQELKHDATNLMLNAGAYQSANPLITSTKSMDFDGSDQLLTTQADTVAQNTTYSFWAKTSTTSRNVVFGHGGVTIGCFSFNYDGNRPILRTGDAKFLYFDDVTQQKDDKWHHWVVYMDYVDLTNSKLYCDGVLQNVNQTSNTGTINAYTQPLTIGADNQAGDNEYEGLITEFGTWDRELTSLEVASLYNQGMPTNLLVNRNNYQSGNPTVFNTKQVDFDGVDDYMVANSTLGSFTGSFSAWVILDSYGSARFLLDARTNSGTGYVFLNLATPSILTASSGTKYVNGVAGNEITTGVWNHIVVTGISLDITESILIGSKFNDTELFDGNLSQIGLWNSTLTADEVSSLYNHGLPIDLTTNQAAYESSSNLVGYWRMGSGTLDTYPLIADQTNATLGSEEFVNGSFTGVANGTDVTTLTNWNTYGSPTSRNVVDNKLVIVATGGNQGAFYTLSSLSAGTYKLSVDVSGDVGAGAIYITGANTYNVATSVGNVEFYFVGLGNTNIFFRAGSNSAGTTSYTNISIKKVNGNPAIMTNQTSSDIENGSPYANLIQNTNFTDSSEWSVAGWNITNNQAVLTGTGAGNNIYISNILELNKTYNIVIDAEISAGSFTVMLGGGGDGYSTVGTISSTGTHTITGKNISTTSNTLLLQSQSGSTPNSLKINSVTLTEVNTGLQGYWKMGDGTNDEYPVIYDQVDPTLGSELITNGNFATDSDWTLGTGATISNNLLNFNNVNNDETRQSNVFPTPPQGIYEVSFDISNYVGGHIDLYLGGYQRFDFNANSNGTWKQLCVINHPSSNTIFYFIGDNFTGSIDNVSVKEVQGNPATMTNMVEGNITNQYPLTKIRNYYRMGDGILDGYPIIQDQTSPNLAHIPTTNLLPYSEDFSEWTATDCSIESGFTAPDGSNTAYKVSDNGAPNGLLYYSGVSAADQARTIYARTVSGTGTAQLTSHNANTNNTFNLTEDWQRFEVNTTTNVATIFYAIDFRGSGTLSEVLLWGAQTEEQSQATAYIKSEGVAAVRKSSTTNLIPYSEDFENAAWSISELSFGSKVTSPIGTNDAITIIETDATAQHNIYDEIVGFTNEAHTLSCYAKLGTSSNRGIFLRVRDGNTSGTSYGIAWYNLSDGTFTMSGGISANIENVGNGWYRCSLTVTAPSGSTYCLIGLANGNSNYYDGDGTSNVLIWGSQVEKQTQAETYAKTTGLPVEIDLFTENNYGTMTNMSASDIVEDTP